MKISVPIPHRHRDVCAGLGIGKSVMVVAKVIAAGGGHGVQLVVRQAATEIIPGTLQGIVEFVVNPIDAVNLKYILQAAFVEGCIMSHNWKISDFRAKLIPDIGEHAGIVGVRRAQPVHLLIMPVIPVGLRLYQRIVRVDNPAALHPYNPNRAYAGAIFVGCLHVQADVIGIEARLIRIQLQRFPERHRQRHVREFRRLAEHRANLLRSPPGNATTDSSHVEEIVLP